MDQRYNTTFEIAQLLNFRDQIGKYDTHVKHIFVVALTVVE